MVGPASMCFCGHRFKEHEYLNPKNKKVTLPYTMIRSSAKDQNAVVLVTAMCQYLAPMILNVFANIPTLNMTQSQRSVQKDNVDATKDFRVGGHVHVDRNMENILLLLKPEMKE